MCPDILDYYSIRCQGNVTFTCEVTQVKEYPNHMCPVPHSMETQHVPSTSSPKLCLDKSCISHPLPCDCQKGTTFCGRFLMKSGQWLKLRLGFSSSQLNMGEERALYFGGNLYCGPVPIISSSHGIDMIYTQIVVGFFERNSRRSDEGETS